MRVHLCRVGILWGSVLGVVLGIAGFAPAGGPPTAGPRAQSIQKVISAGGSAGHPTQDMALSASGGPQELGIDCSGETALPQLTPPVAGPFINFESPQVRPLAVSASGEVLLAANTPHNSLAVLKASDLTVVRQIPVGLEPVSVAFQPGTSDQVAWVANFVSDNVTVVDVTTGAVLAVIGDFDEPVNILFNSSGSHAAVVVQSRGLPQDYSSADYQAGWLMVIDAATHQVASRTFLDQHTPRAAVYDPVSQQILVAALHSGNGTTIVGHAVVFETNDPPPVFGPTQCDLACNCTCVTLNMLEVLRDFSATALIFAGDAHLGPQYPDPHVQPGFAPAPPVQRIIPAAGGGWQAMVDVLSDDAGLPDPAVVDLMNTEFNASNAAEVIASILQERKPQEQRDVLVLDFSSPARGGLPIVQVIPQVGTTLTGMGRSSASGDVFVSNLEARNLVRHEDQLRGHIVDHQLVKIPRGSPRGQPQPIDLHAGLPGFRDPPGPDDPPQGPELEEARAMSLANPIDIVFDSAGHGFLAAFAVDRVASFDEASGTIRDRVDVGRGPRGLALGPGGTQLYVMNRTDLSITRIDASNPDDLQVLQTAALFNPEPAEVRTGRAFLYSAKFSNNYASSCALCHSDGHLDHLAWDLSNPAGSMEPVPPNQQPLQNHPIKGPMVTQSLRGLQNHEHYHWRGDRPSFQDFSGAFDALLGGAPLPAQDTDAFEAFIKTVVYAPNPLYNRDASFLEGPLAAAGACDFIQACGNCHQVTHDGAKLGVPPGAADDGVNLVGAPLFAQIQEIAQLREVHKKLRSDRKTGFGLFHDGRMDSESDENPLQTIMKELFPNLTAQQREQVVAFLLAFQANVSPAVGWQVRASGADGPSQLAEVTAAVTVMAGQYARPAPQPAQADVVARRWSGESWQGFHLVDTDPQIAFQSDTDELIALADLLGGLGLADVAVFTAVPPGSGRRIGVDQDLDCLSDGLDLQPQVDNSHDGDFDGYVGAADFVLLHGCSLIDGPLPSACALFDADCSGQIDAGDFDDFLAAYQDPPADCNANAVLDLVDIFTGASPDADHDAVPDECAADCPGGLAGCADTDGNGIRDDGCLWWTCPAGRCESVAIVFADVGGFIGSCQPDGTADGNDRYHTLNCFSDRDTTGLPPYPCESNPPAAFNVDPGGPFGVCAPDGVCDGNDAFHTLAAFSGDTACSCPGGGPAPAGPDAVQVVARTGLRVRSSRHPARPGQLIVVDVHLTSAVPDLRGYQLHLEVSGGSAGRLELADIYMPDTGVFSAAAVDQSALMPWQAFNVRTGQMVAGLDGPGLPASGGSCLATFVYRAGPDAAGTFVIAPAQRTFLFPTPTLSKIEVSTAQAAVVEVEGQPTPKLGATRRP